jgi:hypothetical protein
MALPAFTISVHIFNVQMFWFSMPMANQQHWRLGIEVASAK